MVAAALGLVATLAGVSFVVRLSPALRGELPGQAESADDAGYLRVVKEDPDAEVIVERPGERLVQGSPGGQSLRELSITSPGSSLAGIIDSSICLAPSAVNGIAPVLTAAQTVPLGTCLDAA